MARRRRSLLGNKGPALPTNGGEPPASAAGSDPLAADGAGAEEPVAAEAGEPPAVAGAEEPVATEASEDPVAGVEEPVATEASEDPAVADAGDPLDDGPVGRPSWLAVDVDLDALRAPTPPPISRRAEVIGLESAPLGAESPSTADPAEDASGPVDYSRAGMAHAMGGFADDPYGAFDDLGDPPPTEEVPAGVYEDVSTPYRAPMNVPEPPPIPGILDRFTPPPVQRTEVGAHQTQGRPSYLAEPTPAPAPERKKPAFQTVEEAREAEDREEEDVRGGPPILLLAGVAVVLVLLIGGIGAVGVLMLGGAEETVATSVVDAGVKRVEVRQDMRQQPGLIGASEDEATEGQAIESEAIEGGATEPPPALPGAAAALIPAAETPEPPQHVEAASPPAPKAAPKAARPKPAPKAAPAPVAAEPGTLKIRANRRVLVYVNGQAIGYTPLDHKVPPGGYSVSAMVPGQPDTKQTLDATLEAGGATAPVDFKF